MMTVAIQWMYALAALVVGLGMLRAQWALVRAEDMAQAQECRKHSAKLLREADACRQAAMVPSLTMPEREELIASATVLTQSSDWWLMRAEKWEKGDI